MNGHNRRTWRRWGAAALMGIATLTNLAPANAAVWGFNRFEFANPVFLNVWSASDQPVMNGTVKRSYTWGPNPWFDYKEYYQQSPNGLRTVQYFDKARMELNNPGNATPSGVTNGLLTVELVSGRVKLGDGTGDDQNIQRQPANVPVAGNPAVANPNAPTYASFRGVATVDNGYRDPDRTGQRVGAVLDKFGNLSNNAGLANDPLTQIVSYNTVTGHNIPRVFRDFIQNGPVDGLFAFGLPISDPYWVRARVGDAEKDILVQLYERRVVTYTPSNPAEFRVEMGNVGQHYFQWRYPHLGQAWSRGLNNPPETQIAYASKIATPDHWEVFLRDPNGFATTQVTSGSQETVPYSWRRSFVDGEQPRLITDSRRDGGLRQVFSINGSNPGDVRQHTVGSDVNSNAFNAAVSPDGTQIALIHQPGNLSSIAIIPFTNTQVVPNAALPYRDNCVYQSPSWLADGSGLVFASNCDGKFAIYRADIQYTYTPSEQYIPASLVNIRPIVKSATADNYFPRVSPDGTRVLFSSNRNGQGDVYMINLDGTGEQRLTTGNADDGAASWSTNGFEIVFDSNRDGDYEIYRLSLYAPENVTQLTFNQVDDRWPLWAQ
ncbi:MAG: PD40 domain-containing protein [Chloroflexi bacterium]|nr:PD40 domain-containing protein [Chloroflexota bacterium]